MNHLLLFLFIFIPLGIQAQPFQLIAQTDFPPQFFDYFLSSEQKDFYLSSDGKRAFINSDLKYSLVSATDGTILAEGKHLPKMNAGIASLLGMIRNKSLNREDAIEKVRFDEGTEYMVFEEDGVILMLDWNRKQQLVKAIDLTSGELLWQTDRYRYSASSASQYVDLIMGMANAGYLHKKRPAELAAANAQLQGYGNHAFIADEASPVAMGFLTPMKGTDLCLLRVQDSYVALNLQSGNEQWTYDRRPLNIGFAEMTQDGNLLLVNFHSSYLKTI